MIWPGGSWTSPRGSGGRQGLGNGRRLVRAGRGGASHDRGTGPVRSAGSGAPRRAGRARSRSLRVFARARDGRVGWQRPDPRDRTDRTGGEIKLLEVGDAQGRLTDQYGRPIAGVEVAPAAMLRSNTNFVWLSPAVRAQFRTTTAADGSFVLRGVYHGGELYAAITAPKFGSPTVSWQPTQTVTISLDSRLGRISGRLRPPEGRRLDLSFPLQLTSPRLPAVSHGHSRCIGPRTLSTAADGTFRFDGVPPGRYTVWAHFNRDGIIADKPEPEVEVGPGGLSTVEIALRLEPRITGRVVNARTGRGVAGISVQSLWRELGRNLLVGEATTDAEGRYSIPALPGKNAVELGEPKAYRLEDRMGLPILQVEADKVAPDLKLIPAAELDGVVVDRAGHPVAGAEVYVLTADGAGYGPPPGRSLQTRTVRFISSGSIPTTRSRSGPARAMRRPRVPSWPGPRRARSRLR